MPSSKAACMIRIDSAFSCTAPMCQPPIQIMDTGTPVLPRMRVGIPVLEALDWPNIALLKAMEPATAVDAWMNSRRVFLSSIVTSEGYGYVRNNAVCRSISRAVDELQGPVVQAWMGRFCPSPFSKRLPSGGPSQRRRDIRLVQYVSYLVNQ